MQETLVKGSSSVDICIFIVWIDMLAEDDWEKAIEASTILPDPRVQHFHDPGKRIGKLVAESIDGEGRIAWDMYLFYPSSCKWTASPPRPMDWAHQLWDEHWPDPERFAWGDDLIPALRQKMLDLIIGSDRG